MLTDLVPYGLWGMEDQGRFRFNVFVTLRADQLTAVGYTNLEGLVDEVRLGRASQMANAIWKRGVDGRWTSSNPSVQVPLIDPPRFSSSDLNRLEIILNRTVGDSDLQSFDNATFR